MVLDTPVKGARLNFFLGGGARRVAVPFTPVTPVVYDESSSFHSEDGKSSDVEEVMPAGGEVLDDGVGGVDQVAGNKVRRGRENVLEEDFGCDMTDESSIMGTMGCSEEKEEEVEEGEEESEEEEEEVEEEEEEEEEEMGVGGDMRKGQANDEAIDDSTLQHSGSGSKVGLGRFLDESFSLDGVGGGFKRGGGGGGFFCGRWGEKI